MNQFEGLNLGLVLDALPQPVLVVDEDVRIAYANAEALKLLQASPGDVLRRRGGDALHCIHSIEHPDGCGHGPACSDCIIRRSVQECIREQKQVRRRTKAQLLHDAHVVELDILLTASPLDAGRAVLVLEDIQDLTTLRQIVSICSHCRKIRNMDHEWQPVEAYFKHEVGLDFSHALCPDCVERHYPEFASSVSKPPQP